MAALRAEAWRAGGTAREQQGWGGKTGGWGAGWGASARDEGTGAGSQEAPSLGTPVAPQGEFGKVVCGPHSKHMESLRLQH